MTARTENFTIEQSLPGERLDIFLRTKFPAVSRGTLQRLIEQGHIRVNGQTVKPTHSPRAGEVIELTWPEARPAEAQPEEMPLDILFEDQSLLVVNKPAGLVVHPAAGHEEHTLVNALLLKNLPFPRPDRLATLYDRYTGVPNAAVDGESINLSGEHWEQLRDSVP